MHLIILNFLLTVLLLSAETVHSKSLNDVGGPRLRIKKSTCILYSGEDSKHSESIKSSQWIKVLEKPNSNSESENMKDNGSILEGLEKLKQDQPLQSQPNEMKKNNNIEIPQSSVQEDKVHVVWLLPKRNISLIESMCRSAKVKKCSSKIDNNTNNSIFDPVCGFNGKEYILFYDPCEFHLVNECQNETDHKWEIVTMTKCINHYKVMPYNDEHFEIDKQRLSETTIEDLVKEKVESFKRPDAKDPNKETTAGDTDSLREETETEKTIDTEDA